MLKLTSGNPVKRKVDTLVVPVCNNKGVSGNSDIDGLVEQIKGYREFAGKKGEVLVLHGMKGVAARRVLFMGLGKSGELDAEKLRKAIGNVVKRCIKDNDKKTGIVVPSLPKLHRDESRLLIAECEGVFLSNYIFDSYKEKTDSRTINSIEMFADKKTVALATDRVDQVQKACEGTLLARTWVSTPSNDKTPDKFVDTVSRQLEGTDIRVSVYNEQQLKKLGFGAMLAVAKGSSNRPSLLVCDYNPEKSKKTVVLVGKGVTFDSGGINLKTAEGLAYMKMDMGGAAVVAGTMYSLTGINPDFRVVGIMPLAENMPSGDALRPGDIVKSYSGKTIEIGNTDAEGRLLLADAMAWAVDQYAPDLIVDFATLTGACIVGLGEKIAGVFTDNDTLARGISASADRTGERCWRLPMPDDYRELLKSDFADISNMASSRSGGAITAALFLSEFVKNTRWAHIDIAGPAYSQKGSDYCPPGGTGFGVRLINDLLSEGAPGLKL